MARDDGERTRTQGEPVEDWLRAVAHLPPVRPRLLPDATLCGGRFVIEDCLGEGGMGVVYRARDAELGSSVAIKVLTGIEPHAIERIKQEFRAVANLRHPHLVRLYELFSDRGQWFFSMELLTGCHFLDHVCPERRLDESRLRKAALELARAIRALHAAGRLHRDIKPSNVMVTETGRAVLLDFGLVASVSAPADQEWGGTPLYMAPEQFEGRPATTASDMYAFGVMLYEALTGQVPFAGSLSQLSLAKRERAAVYPDLHAHGLPADLVQLAAELISRWPAARPDSVALLRRLGEAPDRTLSDALLARGQVFVGRDEELAELHMALASVREEPVCVFVEGAGGIGKSALVERFVEDLEVERRAYVLRGRCHARESIPFKTVDGVVADLVRKACEVLRRPSRALDAELLAALAGMFPVAAELSEVPAVTPSRERALTALHGLLRILTRDRPVVVYVDDLQWGDRDGTDLLARLLGDPLAPPLLLVATYRSEEAATSASVELLADRLTVLGDVRTISMAGLSSVHCLGLARRLGASTDPKQLQLLAAHCDGSPLFARLLARWARDHLALEAAPIPSFESLIAHRMSALDAQSHRLVRLLAVAGRPIGAPTLRKVSGLEDLEPALSRLVSDEFAQARSAAGALLFTMFHDRVREAVLSNIADDETRELHLAWAAALDPDEPSEQLVVARHYLAAGETRKAARVAADGVRRAWGTLAIGQTAELALLAREHSDDPALRLQMAWAHSDALVASGRAADAARAYAELADQLQGPLRDRARCRAAGYLVAAGLQEQGMAMLTGFASELDLELAQEPEPFQQRWVALREQLRTRGHGFTPRPYPSGPAVLFSPRDQARFTDFDKHANTALALCAFGPFGAPSALRCLLAALDTGWTDWIAFQTALASCHVVSYEALGSEFIDSPMQMGPRQPSWATLGYSLFAQAQDAMLRMDGCALELFERAAQAVGASLSASMVEPFRTMHALLFAPLGEFATLARELPGWIRRARLRGNRMVEMQTLSAQAHLLVAKDQPERAVEHLEFLASLPNIPIYGTMNIAASLVSARVYLGQPFDEARLDRRLSELLGTVLGLSRWRFFVLTARATLSLFRAVHRSGRDALLARASEQIDLLEQAGTPGHLGGVCSLRASLAWQRGERERALQLLQDAEAHFVAARLPTRVAVVSLLHAELRAAPGDARRREAAAAELHRHGLHEPYRYSHSVVPGLTAP